MQKITKLIGVDSKAGRRSRTGSTITMGISDKDAIQCQQYFMALESGEEPTGKIKRIELVIYEESDMEELEKIESLETENKELRALIESLNQPIKEAVEQLEEVTGDIQEEESTNGQANESLPPNQLDHGEIPKDVLNENLPPNQLDLKMDGDNEICDCGNSVFVNGKCCNCGGVE